MNNSPTIEQLRLDVEKLKRETANLPPRKPRLITDVALAGAMAAYVRPLVDVLVDYAAFVAKTQQIPAIDLSVFDRYNKVIDASREIAELRTSAWMVGVHWGRSDILESQERLKTGTVDDLYVRELVRRMHLHLKFCTKPYDFGGAVYDYRSTEPFSKYYLPVREVYEKYISDEKLMMEAIDNALQRK